jgi:hypothetical protein
VLTQLLGDELRGLRPAGARGDGGADAVEKFAQFANGVSLCRRHAVSLRLINP